MIYCMDSGRSRHIIYPAPNFCLHKGCLVAADTGSPQGSGIAAWCPFWLWRLMLRVSRVLVAPRAWWRQAAAMLGCPVSSKIPMARFRIR
jgi:hypothetical protein